MPSLRFSQGSRNLYRLPGIDFAQVFIAFVVLLFSLTVHETAHAWTADRLGDPTARLLGRVSLNPVVHADVIGTVIFPLVSMVSGAALIGWAKPVPVNLRFLRHPRRDYMLVAAAGPASNLVLALFAALLLVIVPITPQTLGEANVSVPIANPTQPAAVADDGPADDPLDPTVGSHGLFVCPPNQLSPDASSPVVSLAIKTAPASRSISTTLASYSSC